jgi:hypothetical protein
MGLQKVRSSAAAHQSGIGSDIPNIVVRYVERIRERGAWRIADGLRARGAQMRKGSLESLQQLWVGLLRIGPAARSGQVLEALCATRSGLAETGASQQQRTGSTYRLRNIAGGLDADVLDVCSRASREVEVARWAGFTVTSSDGTGGLPQVSQATGARPAHARGGQASCIGLATEL